MNKLFVLVLVLTVASVVSAALVIDAPATVIAGTQYDVTVSGLASDITAGGNYAIVIGLYDQDYRAQGIPDRWVVTDAAGNLASVDDFPSYGGVDIIVGDTGIIDPQLGDGVQDGLWVTLTYTAGTAGDALVLDLYDYAVSSTTPATPSVAIIAFVDDIVYPDPYFIISPQSFSFSAYEADTNPNNTS